MLLSASVGWARSIVPITLRIIHRDLKPANIMLVTQADGRERVKVLDFGIGKVLSETAGSPVSSVMGTPHYASPEQFQLQGRIDARTDIYSLGVVLFQMLTGSLPFEATSVHELIRMHMTVSPPPLRTIRPDAPAAIEQLIERLLAKEPDGRPSRVSEIPLLFDDALNVAKSREQVEAQQEQRQADKEHQPLSSESTERLTPADSPTTYLQPPSQLMDLSAVPDMVKISQVDTAHQGDEPSPSLEQPLQSQTGPLGNPNRMIYVGVGSILILIAGLVAVMLQLMIADSGPIPDTGQPTVEPTGQARLEPSPNLAQSPAVVTALPTGEAKEESGLKPNPPATPPAGDRALNTINGRWVINNNDTVLDTQTGLVWMRKDFRVIEGRFVNGWHEAMGWARKMNDRQYAGHGDWKVPSISEYKSIRDRSAYSAAFERQGEDCYWSRNEIGQWVASYIYMSGEYGGAAVSGDKNNGTNKPGVLYKGKFSVRLVRHAKRWRLEKIVFSFQF